MRTILAAAAASLLLAVPAQARSWPTPPGWWLKQAACIRSHEGWWTANTGNSYEGAYQFLDSTWASVGGTVSHGIGASAASPAEQTYRAWLVWRRDGGSWREWGTAGMCGLR